MSEAAIYRETSTHKDVHDGRPGSRRQGRALTGYDVGGYSFRVKGSFRQQPDFRSRASLVDMLCYIIFRYRM